MRTVKTLREQYQLIDELLEKKLQQIPALMEIAGIDMWLVFAKEYNEDPILEFLTPTSFPTARRLTCLIFAKTKEGFKRYNAGRPSSDLDPYYESIFNDVDEKQFAAIRAIIEKINPTKIGLNFSSHYAFGDGLTKSIYDDFANAMSKEILDKVVSAENLCLRYLETRLPEELERYKEIAELAMDIVNEAFSFNVIELGKTTTRDLEWWLKQEVNRLGLPFWFPPTIDLQRKDSGPIYDDVAIERGDLLHVDFGLIYLGLCTDHQRLAYVPQVNETEVPEYLMKAFKENNHFQDIVCTNFIEGRTGNEIFTTSVNQAKAEGITPMLYTHPIGHYGHGPGPTIGLFNEQKEIKVKGDYPLYKNTCYALELNTKRLVPEFSSKDLYVFTEEIIAFDGEKCIYLAKGRDHIHLVK